MKTGSSTAYTLNAHDLIWVSDRQAVTPMGNMNEDSWFDKDWTTDQPLVIRRDSHPEGKIPAGVRGKSRNQRLAVWVNPVKITTIKTPEAIAQSVLSAQNLALFGQYHCYKMLCQLLLLTDHHHWRFSIGVTGSMGFSLATNKIYIHADSDLDLNIKCPSPVDKNQFSFLQPFLEHHLCKIDIQIESPLGGFSLTDWLENTQVLLKTKQAPLLVNNPWQLEKA